MPLDALVQKADFADVTDVAGTPEYPGAVLVGHVALKGAELGSVLATAGVLAHAAGSSIFSKAPTPKTTAARLLRIGSLGMTLGSLASTAMVLSMAHRKPDMDLVGVQDRAYRISHNQRQLQVDAMAGSGAAVGSLSGALLASPLRVGVLRAVLGGAATGLACGVLAFGVQTRVFKQ